MKTWKLSPAENRFRLKLYYLQFLVKIWSLSPAVASYGSNTVECNKGQFMEGITMRRNVNVMRYISVFLRYVLAPSPVFFGIII